MNIYIGIVFLLAYALFLFAFRWRVSVAGAACLLLLVTPALSFREAFGIVHWPILMIFSGTLVVAELFGESGVPAVLAEWIAAKAGRVNRAMLALCALAGIISIAAENVAVVLIVAPIVLEICRRTDTSPIPYVIGVSVSSNLQGAATLIGDPPSMILAGALDLNFNDFFWFEGRPGMFFATEVGFVASLLVLGWLYRKHREPVALDGKGKVESWFPTILLALMTAGLAIASAFTDGLLWGGIVCVAAAVVGGAWNAWRGGGERAVALARAFDWKTTLFLMLVFILVGTLEKSGLVEALASGVHGALGSRPFLAYNGLVWISVVISAFLDNVPYTAAMLPVGAMVATKMGLAPALFLFGIMLGASVGGNISPIGASANIVAMGILDRYGHKAGVTDFFRIGIPFTVFSVLAASLFLWFLWS